MSTEPGSRGAQEKLYSMTYEIHGQVQGVNFRSSAIAAAKDIGCKGVIRNTAKGTVQGELQGTEVCTVACHKSHSTSICSPARQS